MGKETEKVIKEMKKYIDEMDDFGYIINAGASNCTYFYLIAAVNI